MKKLALALALLICATETADAFIRGRNICGVNVAASRRAHGLAVPKNYPVACAWRSLPSRGKHAYAVMVVTRPNGRCHVAEVQPSGACKNPSSRAQQWAYVPCEHIWPGRPRSYHG